LKRVASKQDERKWKEYQEEIDRKEHELELLRQEMSSRKHNLTGSTLEATPYTEYPYTKGESKVFPDRIDETKEEFTSYEDKQVTPHE